MATKYANYITGDDGDTDAYGVYWRAQTLPVTPTNAHTITSVKLKLFRVGSPGTLTVSIRATDSAGRPTGADLCSGTIDGDGLTTDTDGAWYEITLGAGYDIGTLPTMAAQTCTNITADSATGNGTISATKFAIVIRALTGGMTDKVSWKVDTGAGYADGVGYGSSNSGGSWSTGTGFDCMFEDWGDAVVATVTQHGHCWVVAPGVPTTASDKTENGAAVVGAFTSLITGLNPGTEYYTRAYATTAYGTVYSTSKSVTTLGGAAYPSDAQTRVTALIHRFDRGTYTLEMSLGEVISDFGLPEWDASPRTAVPEEEEEPLLPPIPPAPMPGRVHPRPGIIPVPGGITAPTPESVYKPPAYQYPSTPITPVPTPPAPTEAEKQAAFRKKYGDIVLPGDIPSKKESWIKRFLGRGFGL